MTTDKTFSDWAIYMIVGPVILALSLIAAIQVGNDFHQDFLAESVTFIGCNILLWAIFLVMTACPYELMIAKRKKAAKEALPEITPDKVSIQKSSSHSVPALYSHEDYVKIIETHTSNAKEEKEKRVAVVLDYVHRTMSRFLYEDDLNTLIGEIRKWSDDCNYTPTPIMRFRQNVENIPLRHFVWNIAERLGRREYSMAARIDFIRTLFPKSFVGLDYSTLKNLKAPCSNDVIPIDEPVNDRYCFHDTADKNLK